MPSPAPAQAIDNKVEMTDKPAEAEQKKGENLPLWKAQKGRYVPLQYKRRYKSDKLEEFSPTRLTRLGHFGSAMSLGALALAWEQAETQFSAPSGVWKVLAGITAAWFLVLLALYACRVVGGGVVRKLTKDWQHPAYSHFFSAITITAFELSALASKEGSSEMKDFGEAIFWVTFVPQIAMTVFQTARWITTYQTPDFMTSAYLITPLANLVGVLSLMSFVDPLSNYWKDAIEIGYFLFSFALFMWVVLFAILLQRFMHHPAELNVLGATHAIWPAAPAIAALAYRSLKVAACLAEATSKADCSDLDALDRFLTHNAFMFSLIGLTVVGKRRFWTADFDMSWWAVSFPLSALALAGTSYHASVDTLTTKIIALGFLTLASIVTVALTVYTGMKYRQMWSPDDKWGPISLMILIHKAFRCSLKKLVKMGENLKEKPDSPEALKKFQGHFKKVWLLLREHTAHEDEIFFPLLNWFYPDVCGEAGNDHEHDGPELDALEQAVLDLSNGGVAEKMETVLPRIKKFKKHFIEHLLLEEMHISPTNRKNVNWQLMKETGKRVFLHSEKHWRVLLPFIINHLPKPKPRRRFLECLRYIIPDRLQGVGIMVYEGVNEAIWNEVSTAVPEIIPRNIPGWVRRW